MTPFDAQGSYRPEVDDSQTRRLAVRGAAVTVLSGGLGLALQIVSTVVLARLLTPHDFGLVALVTTFSLLLTNFGLNGFTEAILQREEIDHFLISNLFWINVAGGILLTAAFAAAGSLLVLFYHDPLVRPVSVGISLTIFFSCISVQHLALLKRAMRFATVSANETVSRIVSLVVSIVMAWDGYGYWALVVGAVAGALAQTLGAWYLCRWVPSLPRRAAGTGSMVHFALNVYGRFSLNYLSRNTDNLLVGWSFGANVLGIYKKAYDLFALSAGQLSAPLTNVAVAALSRFDPRSDSYRKHLTAGLSIMAFVGMGLSGLLTLIGADLIRLMLGPVWAPTGRIFTFFGPGIGAMILYYIHGWIHLSIGRPDRWLRWGMVEASVTTLLFLVGLPWGPAGIAVAWTASFWILTIPALWYAGSPVQLGVTPLIRAAWKFIVAALVAGLGSRWIAQSLQSAGWLAGEDNALPRVLATSLIYTGLFLVLLLIFYRGWSPILELADVPKQVMSLDASGEPAPAQADTSAAAGKSFLEARTPPAGVDREAVLPYLDTAAPDAETAGVEEARTGWNRFRPNRFRSGEAGTGNGQVRKPPLKISSRPRSNSSVG